MNRFLAALLCVILTASPAWAVLPSITAENSGINTNDLTVSITVATGDTLYVGCVWDNDANTLTVTHNGDAVTELVLQGSSSTNLAAGIYRRLSPDVGTFNVLANLSAATGISCYVAAIANVDQTTPETNTASTEAGGGTSQTNDISCAAGNLAFDVLGLNVETVTSVTAGANQTAQLNNATAGSWAAASTESGAGTTTMSWSWTGTAQRVHALTCLMGAVAATSKIIIAD